MKKDKLNKSKENQTLLGYPIIEYKNKQESGTIEILSWEDWKKSLDKEVLEVYNKLI